MSGLLLQPVPHDEAMSFIKGKPVVSQRVFKKMLPELKARAFAVAGVESADVLQRLRERLADLPAGGQWDDIKKDLVTDLSPFLVTSDDPEKAAGQARSATARAELLLRIHGFQSYSAAAHRELDEQRDVFTHWKYLSMEDRKVRHTHAALNGTILPHDSPFWRHHYPPWEWGCRCQVVGMMEDEVAEIAEAEKDLPPESQNVFTGPRLKALENEGKLHRGPSQTLDVRSAVEKGDDHGFSWEPGSLKLSVDDIKGRYDAQTWSEWETWAKQERIEELDQSVWEWMGGAASGTAPVTQAVKSVAKTVAAVPPLPPPVPAAAAPVTDVPSWLASAGVKDAANHVFTPGEVQALMDELREDQPASVTEVTTSISGNKHFNKTALSHMVQEYLDHLPPHVARALPKVKVKIQPTLSGALGSYSPGEKMVRLNGGSLVTEGELRRVVFHELTHWVHIHGPSSYRDAIRAHMSQRTAGFTEALAVLQGKGGASYGPGCTGMRDDFADLLGDEYAGRIYPHEVTANPLGLEIPTRHLEALAHSPALLTAMLNHRSVKTGNYAWRETFLEAAKILFHPTPTP